MYAKELTTPSVAETPSSAPCVMKYMDVIAVPYPSVVWLILRLSFS
jgi:hypothetical protein